MQAIHQRAGCSPYFGCTLVDRLYGGGRMGSRENRVTVEHGRATPRAANREPANASREPRDPEPTGSEVLEAPRQQIPRVAPEVLADGEVGAVLDEVAAVLLVVDVQAAGALDRQAVQHDRLPRAID